MDNKPFVFIAAADQDFMHRIKAALHGSVNLNIFDDGEAFRQALAAHGPQALILDTRLTGGYELHRAIRDDFDTGDIYQLLLCTADEAARDDLVADDFLPGPISDGVVLGKVRLLLQTLEQRRRGGEQMAYAQKVAMTAMSSMGELGVVMNFMSKSFSCRSIQSVGELALQSLAQYELDCIVYFSWEGEHSIARSGGQEVSPEDREHIMQLRPLGRLLELNGQMIVNFEHTSILVRQMPDDVEQRGRLRDNIAMLCEGVEARVTGLLMEHDNVLKQQGIRYAVCEIRDSVANLHARQLDYLKTGRDMIGQVTDDFEDAFVHLALMPEAENQLISQLVNLRQRLTDLWSQPGEVEARLQSVVHALEVLAGDVGASR